MSLLEASPPAVVDGARATAAEVLRGPQAREVLALALDSAGLTLDDWHVSHVHARPGAETSVGYTVTAAGHSLYLVASTAALTPAQAASASASRLESPVGAVYVWAYPADPMLPGLAAACDSASVADLLSTACGTSVDVVSLELLVYRPLRRAVLRAVVLSDGAQRTVFVKVVRPDRAGAVLSRHLVGDGLSARPVWDLGDGIVALAEAPGASLAEALCGVAGEPPHPGAIVDALNGLPREVVQLQARRSVPSRLNEYAHTARGAATDHAAFDRLVGRVKTLIGDDAPGPVVPTHGDLTVSNIFLAARSGSPAVSALIDLDTMGPGYRVDDLACLVAHLSVLHTLDPVGYAGVGRYLDGVLSEFDASESPVQLRARAAAIVISLVGPHLTEQLAGEWIGIAEDLATDAESKQRPNQR